MVSNEQSGAFSCTRRGWTGRREGGARGGGGWGGLHGNSQVPSCHVWTEIGAVSIGTT